MKKFREYLAASLCSLTFFSGCQSIQPISNEMEIVKKAKNISAPRYFNLEEAVGANSLLINFPDEIPGAKSIEKYLVPEAKYCMVHIRQYHTGERNSKR